MYYFLTGNIAYNNSGIENAEIQRLRLFHRHQQTAKIMTFEYNRYLGLDASRESLKPDDVLNMYDFFQDSTEYTGPRANAKNFVINGATAVPDSWRVNMMLGQEKVATVFPFTDPQHYDGGQIEHVEFYGNDGKVWRKDYYDVRGFRSSTEYYDQQQHLTMVMLLNPAGKVVVRLAARIKNNHRTWTTIILNYRGQQYQFPNEQKLQGFFLDQAVDADNDTLIIDSSFAVNPGFYNMKKDVRAYAFWHNTHTWNPNAPLTSPLNDVLQAQIEHADRFKGILVSTHQQAHDLAQRFGHDKPVLAIPVGTVSQQTLDAPLPPFSARNQHHIINVARIHEQKKLEDTMAVFINVKKAVPDATLTIHGYVNDKNIEQALKQQAADAGVSDAVEFAPYTPNIEAVYQKAGLFLFTSKYEGFGLALLEAQVAGVPAVSYRTNYGPEDIIEDGQTGYLVNQFDVNAMTAQALKILQDADLANQLSQTAHKEAARFSESNVWQQWLDAGIVR